MNPLKVAVIGAGNWGRNHIRTVASLPATQLVAVCDIDPEQRERVRREHPGVEVTGEIERALSLAEAVVVASPAATHSEIASAAIRRGLPVLVEKPFALSVQSAEEVAALAEREQVPLLVGHLLVFHPAVERLDSMISAGELGDIYYLYSQRVNLGQVRPNENALWSFGPHDISVALALVGDRPQRVSAHGKSYLQRGIEDVVFMTIEFESGIMAHAQMSWLDPHKERRLTVVGSEKMVVFDDMQVREKLKVFDRGVDRPPEYASYGESLAIREGDIWLPRTPNVEPLAAELKHFVKVARGEVAPRTDARSGVEVVRILEAASHSLTASGEVVELYAAGASRA